MCVSVIDSKWFPYGIGGHVFVPSTLVVKPMLTSLCKQSKSIVDATNELLQQVHNFFHPLLPHLSSSLTWSPSTPHNCSTTMLKSNQFYTTIIRLTKTQLCNQIKVQVETEPHQTLT